MKKPQKWRQSTIIFACKKFIIDYLKHVFQLFSSICEILVCACLLYMCLCVCVRGGQPPLVDFYAFIICPHVVLVSWPLYLSTLRFLPLQIFLFANARHDWSALVHNPAVAFHWSQRRSGHEWSKCLSKDFYVSIYVLTFIIFRFQCFFFNFTCYCLMIHW